MNKSAFGTKSKRFPVKRFIPEDSGNWDDLFLSGNKHLQSQPEPEYFRPRSPPRKPKEIDTSKPKSLHWDSSFQKNYEANLPARNYTPLRPDSFKFTEIPHLLDGFLILNNAQADDPQKVISLNLSRKDLKFVIEEDLLMFNNLESLDLSENSVPFARVGILPQLKKLNFSCNGVKSLDLDVDGRFAKLESLDLSFNRIDVASQIVLASLPSLKCLDLSKNGIRELATQILDMTNWKDRVIELLLPCQVIEGLALPPISQEIRDCGFKTLEKLVLDFNPIGSFVANWKVLAEIPLLSKLSMNKCNIPNLDALLPENVSRVEIFNGCERHERFSGFKNLVELHLAYNNFNKESDISPLICLSGLKNVYLEGNPFAVKHLHFKTETGSNLFHILKSKFEITISDACFANENTFVKAKPKVASKQSSSQGDRASKQARRTKLLSKLEFKPNNVDKTLITATHILGNQPKEADESVMEEQLPTNILSTVIELRKALKGSKI